MDPYKNETTNSEFEKLFPRKYLGALNTTYLAFIEYHQRKRKSTFLKKILEINDWPYKHEKAAS